MIYDTKKTQYLGVKVLKSHNTRESALHEVARKICADMVSGNLIRQQLTRLENLVIHRVAADPRLSLQEALAPMEQVSDLLYNALLLRRLSQTTSHCYCPKFCITQSNNLLSRFDVATNYSRIRAVADRNPLVNAMFWKELHHDTTNTEQEIVRKNPTILI